MALFALLALLCTEMGLAVRRIHAEGLSREQWADADRFAQRFCLTSDAHLVCDDHSTISIYSAFYNRRKDPSCGPALVPTDATVESCEANFTLVQAVASCNGKHECSLPPSMHPSCSKLPFRHSRIVWYCVPDGSAAKEEEDVDVEEEEEMELEEGELQPHGELPTLPPLTTTTPVPEAVLPPGKVGKSSVNFCTSQPVHLTCPEGFGIELYSAFYNTRRQGSCEAHHSSACSVEVSAPTCSCFPNATDLVLGKCEKGSTVCTVPPEEQGRDFSGAAPTARLPRPKGSPVRRGARAV